jgi:glycosyltransferase involved in cell wall biosynthesis
MRITPKKTPKVLYDHQIFSTEDIRNQVEKVITSPALQKELSLKGKERLQAFSWEKCSAQTMEVYKKVCK